MRINSNVLKRTSSFIFVLIVLVLVTWITIEPAPLFFDDRSILPNKGFASGPLINPFSSIFSLEGITTFPTGASPYGSLYSYFYKLYSIIGNGIVGRYSLINMGILTITLLFLYQWFRKMNNHFFGIAAMIFFTFTIPQWIMALAHSSSPATMMTLFTALALYIYYFYYRKSTSIFKQIIFLSLLFFFTRASILMKGEGRLVFPIIFIFLIIKSFLIFIKERKENSSFKTITPLPLFEYKNIFLLLSLFFICVPVIPLFTNRIDLPLTVSETELLSVYGGSWKIKILATYFPGLMTLTPSTGEGFIHTNYTFYYELLRRFFTLLRGFDLFALFVVAFSLIIYFLQKKKDEEKKQTGMPEIQELACFSCIWFLLTFIAVLLLRGLATFNPQYVYPSWLYSDIMYVMFPFTIFLFTSMTLAYNSLIYHKKYFVCAIIFLLVLHTITIFQFSGQYLDYISGIDSAAKFLSTTYMSATVIIVHQGSLPIDIQMNPPYSFSFIDHVFYIPENCSFLQENRLVIPPSANTAPWQQINITISMQDNIFFVSNEPLKSTCPLLSFFMKMPPTSETIYYKFKNFFRLSKETYIYKLVLSSM